MVNHKRERIFLILTGLIGAVALIGQLYLYIHNRLVPLPEVILRYLGFFTIQSNIMITVCAALLVLKPQSKWGRFFSRPTIKSAITVYIIVVGLVYNLILRKIWNPEGFQMMIDNLLHVVIPVLFPLYWIIYVPKKGLNWNVFAWLIYPFVYAVYTLARGAIIDYYPYPFLNVTKWGYPKVLVNCGFLLLLFLGLSLLLVAVAKFLARRTNKKEAVG